MYEHKLIVSLLIVLVSFYSLDAQGKEQIVIIGERVGEGIDQEEREKYNLSPDSPGFQSATYYKNYENMYFLEMTYLDENSGELKTSRVQKSETNIRNSAHTIKNFKKINYEASTEDEKIVEQNEQTNDESGQRKRVEFAERKICISLFGFGLPIVENGPEKFDGSHYWPIMISSPRFPIAILHSSGSHAGGKHSTESLTREFTYSTTSLLYMRPITKSKKTNIFAGAGIGSINLTEWKSGADSQEVSIKERLYSAEIGLKTQSPFFGFFVKYKWFYAKQVRNCMQLILGIDFNLYF